MNTETKTQQLWFWVLALVNEIIIAIILNGQ